MGPVAKQWASPFWVDIPSGECENQPSPLLSFCPPDTGREKEDVALDALSPNQLCQDHK